MSRRSLIVLSLFLLPLAGCGRMGALERPGPLFGQAPAEGTEAEGREPGVSMKTIDPREGITPVLPRTDPAPAATPQ